MGGASLLFPFPGLPTSLSTTALLNMSTSAENISTDVSVQPKPTRIRKGGRQRGRERKLQVLQEVGKKLTEVTFSSVFLHKSSELSLVTIKAVVEQLGYHPYNLIDVVLDPLSSSKPRPLVAVLYPLLSNDIGGRYAKKKGGRKPFPTTMWIVSRDLHSRISKLEDMGWVQKLQRRLTHGHERTSNTSNSDHVVNKKDGSCTSDSIPTSSNLKDSSGSSSSGSGSGGNDDSMRWREQMRMAHEQYAAFRWSLLNPDDVREVTAKGWMSALKDVGIAGMASFSTVKCLHCHYAHHLARPQDGNIVGEWVAELLEQQQQQLLLQQQQQQPQQQQPIETEKITDIDCNQTHHEEVAVNNNTSDVISIDHSPCSNDKSSSSNVAHAHGSSSSSSVMVSNQKISADPSMIDVSVSQREQHDINRSFEVTPNTSFVCFRINKSSGDNTNSNNSRSSCCIG